MARAEQPLRLTSTALQPACRSAWAEKPFANNSQQLYLCAIVNCGQSTGCAGTRIVGSTLHLSVPTRCSRRFLAPSTKNQRFAADERCSRLPASLQPQHRSCAIQPERTDSPTSAERLSHMNTTRRLQQSCRNVCYTAEHDKCSSKEHLLQIECQTLSLTRRRAVPSL